MSSFSMIDLKTLLRTTLFCCLHHVGFVLALAVLKVVCLFVRLEYGYYYLVISFIYLAPVYNSVILFYFL